MRVQHVEFFHKDHFAHSYLRRKPRKSLAHFIDFFWETDFDGLWDKHPDGFSDALFPNIGYTYLINLGTPFIMQLDDESFEVRSDGYLPRHKNMICHHLVGNRIFGIKFRVSPVVFEKRINFSEYREYIFPLAYLIDGSVMDKVKTAGSFLKRVEILSSYYEHIVENGAGSLKHVDIVTGILSECYEKNNFNASIEELAAACSISSRTLQRYFEAATGISSKQALQIMRIRKALEDLTSHPSSFHFSTYGYYDYSHFYKHLRSFITRHTSDSIRAHLQLLRGG